MCGIAGIFQFKNTSFNNNHYLNWCLKTMHHRGPDSNGVWENKTYHTAFARLSIRDLSHNGDQPMHSADGRYVLSFNGEIYNSDKFKKILEEDGVKFVSTADTEVLLYSLIKWKAEDILPQINGMFAFAFYDKQENKLLLARDRVGIKPLYVGHCDDGIVFSSQYDHIINHPYCSANEIDGDALNLYMCLGYVPDGKGIIHKTQLLPHGHYLNAGDGNWQVKPYYQYPVEKSSTKQTAEEILQQCVDQQLVSDVPLGAFMSGGTDSTLVTYAATKNHCIQSFTIGVDDKVIDETEDAAAFAKYFNTEHFTRHVSKDDLLNYIQKNTAAYSEPFADFSSIPTLILSEFVRKHVTVALSGDGGDELFWGYPRNSKVFFHHDLLQKLSTALYGKFLMERLLRKPKTVSTRHLKAKGIVDYYYQSLFIAGASVYTKEIVASPNFPEPYFLQQVQALDLDLKNDVQLMNAIRKLEMDLHLQRILIKVDRASMYNSLEVRVPLLDNDMLDYSTAISYESCIENEFGKANLKKLLASKTDDSLVYKSKKGFMIPMRQWLSNELYNDVEDKLMNMPQHLAVHFNKKGIEKMLYLHKTGADDLSWLIWAMYTLVNWDGYHRNIYKNN